MTKKGQGQLTSIWKALIAARSKIEDLEKQKIPPGQWVPFACYHCEEESCAGCKYEGILIAGK